MGDSATQALPGGEPLDGLTARISSHLILLSFRHFDPARLDSSSLEGDKVHHVQIGRGRVEGQADQYYFDTCGLRIGSLSNVIRVSAEFPRDRATIGFALETPRSIQVNSTRLGASDITVFAPGDSADVIFDAGARWATFNLPSADYAAEIAALAEGPGLQQPRGAPLLRPGADSSARFRQRLAEIEIYAHRQPAFFDDARWRLNAERSLRAGFFGLLEDATLLARGRGDMRLRAARNIVRSAEAWVDAGDDSIPSMASLCRALRASRRTIERAFHEVLGLSPAAYFRIRALNAVRRELIDAEPRPGAVARLAVDKGFWHLGRFSEAYRVLFGERPVDTLRRRAGTAGG